MIIASKNKRKVFIIDSDKYRWVKIAGNNQCVALKKKNGKNTSIAKNLLFYSYNKQNENSTPLKSIKIKGKGKRIKKLLFKAENLFNSSTSIITRIKIKNIKTATSRTKSAATYAILNRRTRQHDYFDQISFQSGLKTPVNLNFELHNDRNDRINHLCKRGVEVNELQGFNEEGEAIYNTATYKAVLHNNAIDINFTSGISGITHHTSVEAPIGYRWKGHKQDYCFVLERIKEYRGDVNNLYFAAIKQEESFSDPNEHITYFRGIVPFALDPLKHNEFYFHPINLFYASYASYASHGNNLIVERKIDETKDKENELVSNLNPGAKELKISKLDTISPDAINEFRQAFSDHQYINANISEYEFEYNAKGTVFEDDYKNLRKKEAISQSVREIYGKSLKDKFGKNDEDFDVMWFIGKDNEERKVVSDYISENPWYIDANNLEKEIEIKSASIDLKHFLSYYKFKLMEQYPPQRYFRVFEKLNKFGNDDTKIKEFWNQNRELAPVLNHISNLENEYENSNTIQDDRKFTVTFMPYPKEDEKIQSIKYTSVDRFHSVGITLKIQSDSKDCNYIPYVYETADLGSGNSFFVSQKAATRKINYHCNKNTGIYYMSYRYRDILSEHENLRRSTEYMLTSITPKYKRYKIIRLVEKESELEKTLYENKKDSMEKKQAAEDKLVKKYEEAKIRIPCDYSMLPYYWDQVEVEIYKHI